MARERRLFSDESEDESKREAVKLEGQPWASGPGMARDLGIVANLLGQWYMDANFDA